MKKRTLLGFSLKSEIMVCFGIILLGIFLLMYGEEGNIPLSYIDLISATVVGELNMIIAIFFINKKDFWIYILGAFICYLIAMIYIENGFEKLICGVLYLIQIIYWSSLKIALNRLQR